MTKLRQLIEETHEEDGIRWQTTDEEGFKRAKEGNSKQAKERRLDWNKIEEKDDEGRP